MNTADLRRWTTLALLSWFSLIDFGSARERPRPPESVNLAPEFQELGLAPRTQKTRNTCSLFAITGLAEFESARSASKPLKRLSEEFLVWAANAATGRRGEQAMFYEAVHGLNARGICSEELMPYANRGDRWRTPSHEALADAEALGGRWRAHWIKRWDLERPLDDSQMLAIKEALADGHPVACGLRWRKGYKGPELIEVPPPTDVYDGHSIVLVGYQDDPRESASGNFIFRNSRGPRWGHDGYGNMSYAYVRAYANDALWLELGRPNSEVPAERFEAEDLDALAKENCETSSQKMWRWGGRMWSQGSQLLCKTRENGFVELGFPVKKPGRYRVRVLATAGPNFGQMRIALDGQACDGQFDLYSGRVCPAGSLELGNHELAAGQHRVRFTSVGKNAKSADYFLGLDAIDLIAVE